MGFSHKVDTILYYTLFCSLQIDKDRSGDPLGPFGDIKDVPDSCYKSVDIFIVGSSSPIYHGSKMV